MQNKKALIFLGLAIVFSFLSANYIWHTVSAYQPVVRYDNPVKVVVAAKNIDPYTPLSADQFKLKEIPQSLVPQDAVTVISSLQGKTTRGVMLSGDIIRKGHITEAGGSTNEIVSLLSTLNDPDLRVFFAPIPKEFAVTKGDRVNIIHTKSERGSNEVVTETILESIMVLESTEDNVYLSVTQQQAELLVKAMAEGKISYTISPVHSSRK